MLQNLHVAAINMLALLKLCKLYVKLFYLLYAPFKHVQIIIFFKYM